jgi:hypothetical protein
MPRLVDYPFVVFVVVLLLLWLSSKAGAALRRRNPLADSARNDYGVIQAATLTLLGLILGFSFSMAINRYDQRKNLEEAEANAIGTEFVRADLLPAADAAKVRALLKSYLDLRVRFYTARDKEELRTINADTAKMQDALWAAVLTPAKASPTPLSALAVAGMNDVLNAQGYTQAAWWNRIPVAAWGLMLLIAISCNVLIGYGARNPRTESRLLMVIPVVVAVSFQLIADIDSPHGGIIRVAPQNLHSLASSLP